MVTKVTKRGLLKYPYKDFLPSVCGKFTDSSSTVGGGGNRWNVGTPKEEKMGCGDSITP